MMDSELPNYLGVEAISAACYIKNRLPTSSLKDNQKLYECWYGRVPNVEHLRVFGCTAFVHINDHERQKLNMKSEKMIFVGYQFGTKGYRGYDPKKQKVLVRRDATFDGRSTAKKGNLILLKTLHVLEMKRLLVIRRVKWNW